MYRITKRNSDNKIYDIMVNSDSDLLNHLEATFALTRAEQKTGYHCSMEILAIIKIK